MLVVLVGCDGDVLTPEQRELVTCEFIQDWTCERACLADSGGIRDDMCRFEVAGEPGNCGGALAKIITANGARGCCVLDPEDVIRWYQCE